MLERDSGWIQVSAHEYIEVTRQPLSARFVTHDPIDAAGLAHPYLATPIAVACRWFGRYALHGAGFLHAGRVWGVCGPMQSGKSSIVAWLGANGSTVMADDLLVCEQTTAYSGPRTIDLREDSSSHLGSGEPMGTIGRRRRFRVTPGSAPPAAPIGGFVFLEWGSQLDLQPLAAGERLSLLRTHSVLPPDSASGRALLELASLPAWRFTRPQGLAQLAAAGDHLRSALSQAQ